MLDYIISIFKCRYGTSVLEDNFVARIYTSYDSEGQFLGMLNDFDVVIIYANNIYGRAKLIMYFFIIPKRFIQC